MQNFAGADEMAILGDVAKYPSSAAPRHGHFAMTIVAGINARLAAYPFSRMPMPSSGVACLTEQAQAEKTKEHSRRPIDPAFGDEVEAAHRR